MITSHESFSCKVISTKAKVIESEAANSDPLTPILVFGRPDYHFQGIVGFFTLLSTSVSE